MLRFKVSTSSIISIALTFGAPLKVPAKHFAHASLPLGNADDENSDRLVFHLSSKFVSPRKSIPDLPTWNPINLALRPALTNFDEDNNQLMVWPRTRGPCSG